MKTLINHRLSVLILPLLLIGSPLLAQTEGQINEKTQTYEERVKHYTNYTVEQKESADQFAEIFTGLDVTSVENVYLADLAFSADLSRLREIPEIEATEKEELPIGDYGAAEYGDLFAQESGESDSDGFFIGGSSGGHCPSGGGGIRFWNP